MISTETATVVFTDIVGSTELATRLGHFAYTEKRRSHFEMLRLIASAHRGKQIKSTGDGLMFAFGSAAGAIACMIRMQQATDRAARRCSEELRIRIGASCGETSREGDDIFGMAVVEAVRLCATALSDQILVPEVMRTLTRGLEYKFSSPRALALKGLPEPVLAFTVEWSPDETLDDTIALPPKLSQAPKFGVYGRAAEQAIIEQCWTTSKRGERQLLLLAGEPGIGKTRLAIDMGRNVHRDGAIVLFGSCDEHIGYPYRPFVEALRHYVTNASDEILLRHIGEYHGELLRVAPELAERVPNLPKPETASSETERHLMFEAITGLLACASQQHPVLLILDDLQWAGMPELLLLKHILCSATPMNLLIAGTYRDTQLPRMHPLSALLADLRGETRVKRITLQGLDEAGVIEFVSAAAGHQLNEAELALAREIGRNTEGSPLFVGEILRNLAESGAAVQEGKQWTLSDNAQGLGIPEGVRDAIGRRLSRLSVETNNSLRLASVIGHEFDLVLLEQLAGNSEGLILDAIDEAKSAALVSNIGGAVDRYVFTHMLVRATLYDELDPARRARMHERVGIALERLATDKPHQRVDELARHWIAAATNIVNAKKAVVYARQAGEQAVTSLAFEQAAIYFEQALKLLEQYDANAKSLQCELLIALGDAQRRMGEGRYRQTVAQAVQIARSLGDPKVFALAVLGSARPEHPFANANLVDRSLIGLYEEAIAGLSDGNENILRARLFAHLAGEMLYTPERAQRKEFAREAMAIVRMCGDKAVLAQAMHIYASAINDPTTLTERLALTAEQEAITGELLSLETRWSAAYQRLGALLESGDMAGVEQVLCRLRELASKVRQPFFNWATAHAHAMLSVMSGIPNAEEDVRAAFKLGTAGGQPEAKMAYFSQLSVIRRDQGRHDELIDSLREFAESFSHLPVWRVILAGLYCETDRLTEARNEINKLAPYDFRRSRDWTWPSIVIGVAQICADLGDRELAELFYPELKPVAGQVGVTGIGLVCYGSLAYPCGQLATCLHRWGEAEEYFNQAQAMNARIGAQPYLVRTLRAYATMLLDRNKTGDSTRAFELIAKGRVAANQLGMQRETVRFERLRARVDASFCNDHRQLAVE
jgi:class 3 adenylate cyclase/tetratricopeptide (TPR) repeat protein